MKFQIWTQARFNLHENFDYFCFCLLIFWRQSIPLNPGCSSYLEFIFASRPEFSRDRSEARFYDVRTSKQVKNHCTQCNCGIYNAAERVRCSSFCFQRFSVSDFGRFSSLFFPTLFFHHVIFSTLTARQKLGRGRSYERWAAVGGWASGWVGGWATSWQAGY